MINDNEKAPLKKQNRLSGFSLVELSIVLVILSLLFTGILIPQKERQEQQQETQNKQLFSHIKKSLLGFFLAYKRLPCPASAHSNGEAVFADESSTQCASFAGFLPFKTLGLQGIVSNDGLFLDTWKRPIRYYLSDRDYNNNHEWDWVSNVDISQASTLSNFVGNLRVCDNSDCSNIVHTKKAVVLIHSLGKLDRQSALEQENSGEKHVTVDTKVLGMNNNLTFIYLSKKNLTPENFFDDQLLWISPVELYYYLI